MSVRQFLNGSGKISLADRFISVRFVREALEKRFKLAVVNESPKHLRCKIIRYTRIYGAPIFFLNPTISIFVDVKHNSIDYEFTWPDYYMVVLAAVVGFSVLGFSLFREWAYVSVVALTFFAFLVFLDTKYVSCCVRKTLSKL